MGNIELFSDMTGRMSQTEINDTNISNILDELNRTSDQVDSLNKNLSIVAYGTLAYNWDGTGSGASPVQPTLTTNIQSTGNFIGMSFLSRDTDSPTLYIPLPYFRNIVNANGDTVIDKIFQPKVNGATGTYQIDLNFYATGSPIKYTFYYFIFQQPSSV